jgi:thymidylate synthase (FAD)
MTDLIFRSDVTTTLVSSMGGDRSIIRAMMVSTNKDSTADEMEDAGVAGRINFLMKNRHGTPFEHAAFTFYSEAPIFVYREWHRHRIGVSINEQSGRYSELPPMFYMPGPDRKLQQVGKPGAYEYVEGDSAQYAGVQGSIRHVCHIAYAEYQAMLNGGVAKEVARMVLPINIYSKMYWTCNPRSLMAFLSLRTQRPPKYVHDDSEGCYYDMGSDHSFFPSKPQYEITLAADVMEEIFSQLFPITYKAFVDNGRVAP